MRIVAALEGDLEAHMAAELEEAEKAVTGGGAPGRRAGSSATGGAQITAAGLGQRLARTIRNQHYPKAGASLSAAAMVWSKAPVIVGAHDAGALIRSKNGFWLAIPTPAAGRALGGRRITPGGMGAQDRAAAALRLSAWRALAARRRPGTHHQAREGGGEPGARPGAARVTAPIFILVPQVRLRKRLDLDRAARNWESRLPELIVSNWREERVR